jgi:Subtilase family/PatG Domain
MPQAQSVKLDSTLAATDIAAIAGLSELWARTLGDPRVMIAVLDGPVDLTHPSLMGAYLTQIDTLASGVTAKGPAAQHGTHVASVIFGRHDGPVKGIAPQCRGVIVPVFKDGENGSVTPCSQVDLARAITQAIEFADNEKAQALVINISGGQFTPSGQAHTLLHDVVKNCVKQDDVVNNRPKMEKLVVASAGNQGCECHHIPGAIPSVLTVGAMTLGGSPLDFSNWGELYREQGILAPGENILGASPSGGTVVNSGTSFATPIVSGVAALLLSLQIKEGKRVLVKNVQQGILQSALGCEHQQVTDCRRLLAGRLHIPGAISIINQGANNVTNPTDKATSENEMKASSIVPQADCSPQVALRPSVRQLAIDPAADSNVMPSACGCGAKTAPAEPQKVFALGKLHFDYGTRSRRIYFGEAFRKMENPQSSSIPNIDDPSLLHKYLTRTTATAKNPDGDPYNLLNGPQRQNRAQVTALYWTLQLDETPIYAIIPSGPFAFEIHDTLVGFLHDQIDKIDLQTGTVTTKGAERISVPGHISGDVRLFTGETVPAIKPDIRGMYNWHRYTLDSTYHNL